ncbi:MAG TPA: hypothetical protein PKY82_08830 [Pyrinomonadaceae bacterium]|nr:hypothetical protein [Pyrinomonadaceae bacterium]
MKTKEKKGIGRCLVEGILANLKKDGVTELWLGTSTDNSGDKRYLPQPEESSPVKLLMTLFTN